MKKEEVISSGYKELDELLGGGFKRKEINILASRPGEGKTAFLFDIAKKMANQGIKVFYLHTDTYDKKVLSGKNIFYTAGNLHYHYDYVEYLTSEIKNNEVDVVIIDSLNQGGDPWIQADECQFYHLLALAKKFNIAVIVSNELDRSMYKRKDKEPRISDLRIHGNYQQFVNNTILIKSQYLSVLNLIRNKIPDNYDANNKTICVYNNKKKKIGCFKKLFYFNKDGYLI